MPFTIRRQARKSTAVDLLALLHTGRDPVQFDEERTDLMVVSVGRIGYSTCS
jgi:hypothetical protein